MSPIIIDKITSYKVRAPPTLNQFLLNKAIKEANKQAKGVSGVVLVEGRRMPKSASIVGSVLKGITAETLKEQHPEWVDGYPQYVEEWKEKNLK